MIQIIRWSPEFFTFCVCAAIFFIKRSAKVERDREEDQYAHCLCGARLSEWFIDGVGGSMWHPKYVRGCGWISPWGSHEEYREWAIAHKQDERL